MLNKCVLGTLQLHEHIFHACLLYIYMSTEVTLYVSVVFACLGFLSPANRGSLMTCVLVLYVCLGTPAGYVSARIYKSKLLRSSCRCF